MGFLHLHYYSDDDFGLDHRARKPPPFSVIQKQIGMVLRQQYEPPKDLPHRLFTLLIEADKQTNGRKNVAPQGLKGQPRRRAA
jgi:hypothetical protein